MTCTTIRGKNNTAKIFTEDVEAKALEQIQGMCDDPNFKDCTIRVMPDVHAGKGCTIGTTMTLPDDAVVPNHVGVDIGCGVTAYLLEDQDVNYQKVEEAIVNHVPSGFNVRNKPLKMPLVLSTQLMNLRFLTHLPDKERKRILARAEASFGTLGGGNHFIEIDENPETEDKILVVHSGSRQLGNKCCQHYQKQLGKTDKREIKDLIAGLKSQGREVEIQTEIIKLAEKPKDVLTGQLYKDYLHDQTIIKHYAYFNRLAMLDVIVKEAGLTRTDDLPINSTHNYIDTFHYPAILRKGAVPAYKGLNVIIPFNMKDGVVIARGLGNPDWNYSAPHGAGRKMSRTQAFNELSIDDFRTDMDGIYTESVDKSTLDEAPSAYKSFEEVYNLMLDQTITDPVLYKPVYNYKHHEIN